MIGSLKVYEETLQDQEARREEQLLLSKGVGKPKKYEEGGYHERGCGHGWRGGRGRGMNDERSQENPM